METVYFYCSSYFQKKKLEVWSECNETANECFRQKILFSAKLHLFKSGPTRLGSRSKLQRCLNLEYSKIGKNSVWTFERRRLAFATGYDSKYLANEWSTWPIETLSLLIESKTVSLWYGIVKMQVYVFSRLLTIVKCN